MEILSLGHSAFVFSMAGDGGRPVRILADPWLSDHAVGDLMGRFPRLHPDLARLGRVDGIWLSHSHTDHFDPESLLRLRRELSPFPVLILPASLASLVPLLDRFLDRPDFLVLEEGRPVDFRGLRLEAFFNPEPEGSNEDDVMVLAATNGREALLSESDAALPWHDPDLRALVGELLLGPETEAAALLTTKNQLGATMSMLAARDREDRLARVARALGDLSEEVWAIFGPAGESEDDPLADPRLTRYVGGQGLAVPPESGSGLNRVLFPIRVADRVRLEREIAEQCGAACSIQALAPPAEIARDREEDRRFDPDLEIFARFPLAPLRDEARDREAQERRILAALNDRFLPFLVGARNPPIERLLTGAGGEWRLRVRYGGAGRFEDRDYAVSFARPRFAPAPVAGEAGEHVFANDVEDVLDGRADEFSTFCRAPLPAPAQPFWRSLGMPWLHPDLVEKKLRFHFERAAAGESNADYVLPFWRFPS